MKVTLRELTLLTVIVGLALGWWVDRRLLAEQLSAAEFRAVLAEIDLQFATQRRPALWKISEGPAND